MSLPKLPDFHLDLRARVERVLRELLEDVVHDLLEDVFGPGELEPRQAARARSRAARARRKEGEVSRSSDRN